MNSLRLDLSSGVSPIICEVNETEVRCLSISGSGTNGHEFTVSGSLPTPILLQTFSPNVSRFALQARYLRMD